MMHVLGRFAVAAAAVIATAAVVGPSSAQSCGEDYVVVEGDSLAKIASAVYKQASKWTAIYNANQQVLQSDSTTLTPGLKLKIPCLDSAKPPEPEIAAAETTTPKKSAIAVSPTVTRIDFLTAGDLPPFTDRALFNGGLITDIITSSMVALNEEIGGKVEHEVNWVNDWSAHLNPLLSSRAFDVGFAWEKPDCSKPGKLDANSKYLCKKFFFSDPIFESLELLWVSRDSPIKFESDDEVLNQTFCRPRGLSIHFLDLEAERRWLSEKKIQLLQPQSVDECFRMLNAGEVSGIFLSELTGRAAVARLGLDAKVIGLPRPVSIGTLHAIIVKTHPTSRTMLYYVNSALAKIKDDGKFDEIVERHMAIFWDTDLEDEEEDEEEVDTSTTTPSSEPESGVPTTAAEVAP